MTELRLKPVAGRVFNDPARHRVWVAGRGSGKTHLAVAEALRAAAKPNQRIAFVAPTLDMAKDLAWTLLKDIVPRSMMAGFPREVELAILLKNGSRIRLRSGAEPDRLRGVPYDLVVFDECRDIDPYCWDVVEPRLRYPTGRAVFISTPNGFDWVYKLYCDGQDPTKPDWSSWQTTTIQSGWVDPAKVESARASAAPHQFRQEYEATFETVEGRVYYGFSRRPYPEGNLDSTVVDDGLSELHVGLDFNVNPMSFVIGLRAVDEWLIFDAIEMPTSNTEEVCQYLRKRFPNRPIFVYPDPSGRAHKTSAPAGQTDFTILKRYGFTVMAPPAAPPVRDRINNTNANLCDAAGKRRVRISPTCLPLIKALEGLVYSDTGNNQPDKSHGLDHITDAVGYGLWQRFNLLQRREFRTGSFEG